MLQSRKYRRNANLRGTQLSARGRCIIRRSARIASSKLVSCNGLFIVVPERKAVGRVLRQMIFSNSYVLQLDCDFLKPLCPQEVRSFWVHALLYCWLLATAGLAISDFVGALLALVNVNCF